MIKSSQSPKAYMANIAFLLLFAAEFSYYLLILQTGIVEYHHSHILEIIMMPIGGVLGIVLSTVLYKERGRLFPLILALQFFISLDYAGAGAIELFILGIISGITAPMLIYRIDKLWIAVGALALSYFFGTLSFHILAVDRMPIALVLSAVAFVSTLFADMNKAKKPHTDKITVYSAGSIFLWLLLDSALFETLLRDSSMHIWGIPSFTWIIIVFHGIGLVVAYLLRVWRYVDVTMVVLFIAAYFAYSVGDRLMLSIIYPFVISYYNVTILYRLKSMHYLPLCIVSLSLWAASGIGLMIALAHLFVVAWVVLGILAVAVLFKFFELKLPFCCLILTLKGLR